MIDEETTEKIEHLASETAIRLSNMVPTTQREKSKEAQKELMKLRLSESLKLREYLLRVYETFREQRF